MPKEFLDGYKTYDTSGGFGHAQKWRSAFYDRLNKQEATKILSESGVTPYTLLEIDPEATQAEIKKAFRKKIWQWHPDKNPHRLAEAEAMSKKLNAAYSLLTA